MKISLPRYLFSHTDRWMWKCALAAHRRRAGDIRHVRLRLTENTDLRLSARRDIGSDDKTFSEELSRSFSPLPEPHAKTLENGIADGSISLLKTIVIVAGRNVSQAESTSIPRVGVFGRGSTEGDSPLDSIYSLRGCSEFRKRILARSLVRSWADRNP